MPEAIRQAALDAKRRADEKAALDAQVGLRARKTSLKGGIWEAVSPVKLLLALIFADSASLPDKSYMLDSDRLRT
jgi:hypothetical protein